MFEEVRPIVEAVLKGANGTIITYGAAVTRTRSVSLGLQKPTSQPVEHLLIRLHPMFSNFYYLCEMITSVKRASVTS